MKDFDVIVYGATGFTGRLVADYLARTYAGPERPRWAMAGRSLAKLEEAPDLIGAPGDTPLVVADADDPASIRATIERTTVISTAPSSCSATATARISPMTR